MIVYCDECIHLKGPIYRGYYTCGFSGNDPMPGNEGYDCPAFSPRARNVNLIIPAHGEAWVELEEFGEPSKEDESWNINDWEKVEWGEIKLAPM